MQTRDLSLNPDTFKLCDFVWEDFYFTTNYRTKCSYRLMIHGTNTQKLLLLKNKSHLGERTSAHILCQHSHNSVFPCYQLWPCSGVGRCQQFPQNKENNVTRRGIPVRPGAGRGWVGVALPKQSRTADVI